MLTLDIGQANRKCKDVTSKNINANFKALNTASGVLCKFKSESTSKVPQSDRLFTPKCTVSKGDQRFGERLRGLDKETRRSNKKSRNALSMRV